MSISSLNYEDWVKISAHYWSLLSNDKDDESELKRRGFKPEYIEKILSKKPKKLATIGSLSFTRSVTGFKYELMNYILTILENYEKGNLPFPGTISEQPAQIIEIISVLQSTRSQFISEMQKEETRKQNSKRK
jgi:hypothetical protein